MLIDPQMRSEATVEKSRGQIASLRQPMQELLEAQSQSAKANTQFQTQIGAALSKLAEVTALAYQRLEALEAPG